MPVGFISFIGRKSWKSPLRSPPSRIADLAKHLKDNHNFKWIPMIWNSSFHGQRKFSDVADPSLVWFAAMSTNTVISHQKLRLKPAFFCPKTSKYAQGAIVSEKVIAWAALSFNIGHACSQFNRLPGFMMMKSSQSKKSNFSHVHKTYSVGLCQW